MGWGEQSLINNNEKLHRPFLPAQSYPANEDHRNKICIPFPAAHFREELMFALNVNKTPRFIPNRHGGADY